jgi:phage regulator Rha-like protein
MSDLIAVEHQGVLVIDSRLIAEELGLSHSTWMTNVIKKYQALLEANFGHLHFENGTVTNSVGAVNKVIFAWLMEDQATFLMTLSRNTQQVINAKIKLVKAFSEAKSRLAAKQVVIAPTTPQPALPTPKEISELYDLTLAAAGVDLKLVAGAKLNAIARLHPQFASAAEIGKPALGIEVEDALLTPTRLAEILSESDNVDLTARQVNQLLLDQNFQIKNPGSKNPAYLPTEKGKKHSQIILNTAIGHDKTVQTLRWFKSVLEALEVNDH